MQSEKLAVVGRMASSIAHEINNPLESVTNLLYIARHTDDKEEVGRLLDLADSELRRVAVITNQTLRFHRQASHPQDISDVDLVDSVLTMFEGKLRNSRIVVENRMRADRPVRVFEGDIRQVLNNLVGNAIDAMPLGGLLVIRSREATNWRTGDQGLMLTIADNGPGMPPEVLARVFEAFYTTKGIGGSGLGLWISGEIVERHSGTLRLRSSQHPNHRGTVATLFLPFDVMPSTAPIA
jgi:signal transduction histidine kinase